MCFPLLRLWLPAAPAAILQQKWKACFSQGCRSDGPGRHRAVQSGQLPLPRQCLCPGQLLGCVCPTIPSLWHALRSLWVRAAHGPVSGLPPAAPRPVSAGAAVGVLSSGCWTSLEVTTCLLSSWPLWDPHSTVASGPHSMALGSKTRQKLGHLLRPRLGVTYAEPAWLTSVGRGQLVTGSLRQRGISSSGFEYGAGFRGGAGCGGAKEG